MPHVPLQFNTITCQNCGGIVALLPPGALIVTTKLRCVQCGTQRALIPPPTPDRERLVTSLAPA
jgi:hypothetical protein